MELGKKLLEKQCAKTETHAQNIQSKGSQGQMCALPNLKNDRKSIILLCALPQSLNP